MIKRIFVMLLALVLLTSSASALSSVLVTTGYESNHNNGEITISTNLTSVTCQDGETAVVGILVDVDGNIALNITGDVAAGGTFTFTADNYDMFNDLQINFIDTFNNLQYQVVLNDGEDLWTENMNGGSFDWSFDRMDTTCTLYFNPITGDEDDDSRTTTTTIDGEVDSRDGDDSVDIFSSGSLPKGKTADLMTIIVEPINWLIIAFAYVGAWLCAKAREMVNEYNVWVLGTIGWFLPVGVLALGYNAFALNYVTGSGAILLGIVQFALYGAIAVVLAGKQGVKKKSKKMV